MENKRDKTSEKQRKQNEEKTRGKNSERESKSKRDSRRDCTHEREKERERGDPVDTGEAIIIVSGVATGHR